MKKPIGEASADSIQIEAVLRAVTVGETVSYEVINAAIGRDVQGEARGNLATARRRLLREHLVFGCDPGFGIKRLSDVAIVGLGDNIVQRVGRAAKKGVHTVLSVENWDALPEHLKGRHNSVAIILGAQAALAGTKSKNRILKKIEAAKPLTLEDVRATMKATLESL